MIISHFRVYEIVPLLRHCDTMTALFGNFTADRNFPIQYRRPQQVSSTATTSVSGCVWMCVCACKYVYFLKQNWWKFKIYLVFITLFYFSGCWQHRTRPGQQQSWALLVLWIFSLMKNYIIFIFYQILEKNWGRLFKCDWLRNRVQGIGGEKYLLSIKNKTNTSASAQLWPAWSSRGVSVCVCVSLFE